ncbi:hypothetical protein F3087_41700 [Nocardia colli]|uniref:Uncharacterized protein n=1 Tax=Nocardia colli TaxID=2545717 RepID=A0A5N0DWF2_9NOCA|nr:hypothetical protein F3087_41700 [Nocardia colli]
MDRSRASCRRLRTPRRAARHCKRGYCWAGLVVETCSCSSGEGRIGGIRRPHFARPAGCGPLGGAHDPESVWHLISKTVLAEWSGTQPSVIDVRTEVWLPSRKRRSDVQVVFADVHRAALEA